MVADASYAERMVNNAAVAASVVAPDVATFVKENACTLRHEWEDQPFRFVSVSIRVRLFVK